MPTPQPGIFALGTRSHVHLELDVHPSADPDAVRAAVARLRAPSFTTGGANLVLGFGRDLWRSLATPGESAPEVAADLEDFVTLGSPDGRGAPATQHDLWVWVHGTGEDIVFDTSRAVVTTLGAVARLASEVRGFVFRDGRDLTGFVDGTANPAVADAVVDAVVPPGEPGAGGSIALVQRFVHDLGAFHAQDLAHQEAVIGRTRADSIELDDEHKPPTAHIARTELHDAAGEELPVWRRSVPYGTTAEHGLVFVAFSRDRARLDTMLRRMYGLADDGLRDALLDYTRAVTGSYYWCPPAEALPSRTDED